MKGALETINSLERDGIIGRYAIGGAMAAVFYSEPISTFDLDIFVVFPTKPSGLISLSPLYEALANRGYRESGECVEIEGIPVQFLPAYNSLVEEALQKAIDVIYEGIPTRVLGCEYLIAIAVQTGRPKDRSRVEMLMSFAELDIPLLTDILSRHGLKGAWEAWTR
ncbi:MAG TPA: hypothetical protein VIO60_11085 [Rectinemataceae bacterium]